MELTLMYLVNYWRNDMIRSYIFNQDIEKKYIENFNNYVLDILYGGNVLIGSDIENEWKDVSADGEE